MNYSLFRGACAFALGLSIALGWSAAHAQGVPMGATVASDGNCPSTSQLAPGPSRYVYQNSKGALCVGTIDVTITDVTLDAGSNIIGKVQIDQSVPGTSNAVVVVGDTYSHITTSTTTTVSGAHTLKAVNVNTKGTVASTVTLKDGSTTLAVIDSLNLSGTWTFNIACATSIVIVTTGAPDITVTYQ